MPQTPHAVQWIRPEAQEGCDVSDWFNILVLHQNRLFFTLKKLHKTYTNVELKKKKKNQQAWQTQSWPVGLRLACYSQAWA